MSEKLQAADLEFAPARERSLSIFGEIDRRMLERLRPQIAELTAESSEPIRLFIDSRGGIDEVGTEILRLLREQRGDAPARKIITVAVGSALSAAANLLSAGDVAIAYADSVLMWHGVRFAVTDRQQITSDYVQLLAQGLPILRERDAAKLAHVSAGRQDAILALQRPLFGEYRAEKCDQKLTDVQCLQGLLRRRLSPNGQEVLDRAVAFDDVAWDLMSAFRKQLPRGRAITSTELRKAMLNAAVEHATRPGWDGGLSAVADYFFFLAEFYDIERLRDWVESQQDAPAADVEADDDLYFRQFFRSVCRALQQGENEITARDAMWLGLIDTVQ